MIHLTTAYSPEILKNATLTKAIEQATESFKNCPVITYSHGIFISSPSSPNEGAM